MIKKLLIQFINLNVKWKFRVLLLTIMVITFIFSLTLRIIKKENNKTDIVQQKEEVMSEYDVVEHNNEALKGNFMYKKEISTYVHEPDRFIKLVVTYSNELNVPYEWFLCAIKSESNFNPLATNGKGSGALGFIQFMPFNYTSDEFDNLTKSQFINLGWEKQLYYTYRYLNNRIDSKSEKNITITDFTDFYMIIFYPEAVGKPTTYEIARYHTKNSVIKKRYIQNSGCDMFTTGQKVVYNKNYKVEPNPDKILTKRDMQVWLYNRFPQAYNLNKQ